MDAVSSPRFPSPSAPIPARAKRALAAMSGSALPLPAAPLPIAAPRATTAPLSFPKQLGLGLAIFAAVLAAALPLAFVSEGFALAAAVGVGSVLVALLARRLRIALLIATLLAVLGAFAATHSIHLSLGEPAHHTRLAALAPAAGIVTRGERALPMATVVVMPVRAELGGAPLPIAGWAFPAALFLLWASGFAAISLNRALARWLWRRFGG